MTVIKIKSSSVQGKTPAAGDLQTAELAINLVDQKLYSKDAGGTVFELGAAGDVPSGDTPPSTGNNVGDLFFDTTTNQLLYWNGSAWEEVGGGSEVLISDTAPAVADLEEGTLWWNSSEDDLQLYVLYNNGTVGTPNFNWIEASPMPGAPIGYPDLDYENGATLDDYFVKQAGDNMTGDLTLGTDKITLDATDGSAEFAGGNASINSGGGIEAVFLTAIGDGADGCINVYDKDNLVTPTARINADGSATFANRLDIRGGVLTDGGSSLSTGLYYRDDSESHGLSLYSNGSLETNRKVFIKTDGNATFAGLLKAGGDYVTGNGVGAAPWGELLVRNDEVGVKGALSVYSGGTGVGNVKARIYNDGSAKFAGTVIENTTITRSVVIETEPDNPANYTTTTDAEGNETQVYNGPTLDVKESIQTAAAARDAMRETFQELLVAVQSATDFGELKAAMLVALEDYAV